MAKETKAVIKDEVPDFKWSWWTRLPNIVLQKVSDPYELALLFVIRKVAGDDIEDGVCYMSLRTLASISKMGFNTVRRKILSLAEKGLIKAEMKKAPRGWNVYHLTFPRSVWEENEQVYRELSQKGKDGEEVYQNGTDKSLVLQSVPERYTTVPEELQDCTRGYDETKNHITKNHITKKVESTSEKRARLLEKDERGRYLDRSPVQRCKECGQYPRECYCDEGPTLPD